MKYVIEKEGDETLIHLLGPLSEQSAKGLSTVMDALAGVSDVVFDCSGISDINSLGCRLWTDFIRRIPAGTNYRFQDCSPMFVNYLNLVTDMCGRGEVVSIRVPYRCGHCGKAVERSVAVADGRKLKTFDKVPCDVCGSATDAEVDAEDYFSFAE